MYREFSDDSKIIKLYLNRVNQLVMWVHDAREFEFIISNDEFAKLFNALEIKTPWMSCAMYPVVENPTPVYFSQIDGRVVQIGDKEYF